MNKEHIDSMATFALSNPQTMTTPLVCVSLACRCAVMANLSALLVWCSQVGLTFCEKHTKKMLFCGELDENYWCDSHFCQSNI